MNVLPAQKLSIGQFYLSLAAGLMFFLLPNDARNQIVGDGFREAYIVLIALVITVVLFIITKRYEAVGVSLITMAVLNSFFLLAEIVIGFSSDLSDYWPDLSQYRIVSICLLCFVPFMFCVVVRLLAQGSRDNNESRRDFAAFMASSMKALLVFYVLIFIFKLLMPIRPSNDNRELIWMPLYRIISCFDGTYENGIIYILWHCIVLAPLSFYLSVLVPKFRVWQIAIIAATLGAGVEIMQFILNTASACIDDIIMLMIGAMLGHFVKQAIDKLRSIMTDGEDTYMLSFDYKHKRIKPKGEAQVLTEE